MQKTEVMRTVIKPTEGWVALRLDELWQYRELLYFLTWRDIKVRYKQTLLGAIWAVLQPIMTMVVFTIIFGKFGNISSDGFPYPVFAYVGLLPWQLFAYSLSESGNSLVASQNLITKVYFPRLVIPIAPVLAGLADFTISFSVLIVLMLYYGIVPGISIVTLPLFILLAVSSSVAAGLWLSALNVKYRDVRYTIPFLMQIWLYLTPVAYPASMVPEKYRLFYALNPMTGVVEGFRWALLGKQPTSPLMWLVSMTVVALMLVGGLFYFRRMEKTFADVV